MKKEYKYNWKNVIILGLFFIGGIILLIFKAYFWAIDFFIGFLVLLMLNKVNNILQKRENGRQD